MGEFIGGVGAAFIMAAAVAVIVKLMMDTGIIKDKDAVLRQAKISLLTICVGGVYIFAVALMQNELNEKINLFDYPRVYDFLGLSKTLRAAQTPDMKGLIGGMRMPLYPLLVHGAGRLIFEKYGYAAQFVSFAASCVSACLINTLISKKLSKTSTARFMMIAGALPFAFVMFAPSYISTAVAFCLLGAYALSKKRVKIFIFMSLLALLTCKLCIAVFLMYPLSKHADKILDVIDRKILSNGILFRVFLTVSTLINSAILLTAIKGVA